MRTEGVLAVRKAEYAFAIEECALPVILDARKIGCSSGEHVAAFLNAVGVPAPNGGYTDAEVSAGQWTKNSANRAIAYLTGNGLIDWPRHRGRRNPALELMRQTMFDKAVTKSAKKHGYHASQNPPAHAS